MEAPAYLPVMAQVPLGGWTVKLCPGSVLGASL